MTDWGLMTTIKKTRIPNIGTLVFLYCLLSLFLNTHIYFSDSLLVEAVMHTAMVYSKVSE